MKIIQCNKITTLKQNKKQNNFNFNINKKQKLIKIKSGKY